VEAQLRFHPAADLLHLGHLAPGAGAGAGEGGDRRRVKP
jgi:hypothetical protein